MKIGTNDIANAEQGRTRLHTVNITKWNEKNDNNGAAKKTKAEILIILACPISLPTFADIRRQIVTGITRIIINSELVCAFIYIGAPLW